MRKNKLKKINEEVDELNKIKKSKLLKKAKKAIREGLRQYYEDKEVERGYNNTN